MVDNILDAKDTEIQMGQSESNTSARSVYSIIGKYIVIICIMICVVL